MASSFSSLKKSRTNAFDKLNKQLSSMANSGYSNPDEDKYWQPKVDASGNGMAIIRFLPAPNGEDMPFIRLWTHGFQGPSGKWYIENCRSTINEDDPVNDLNNTLWNSGVEADKEIARKQKRRLSYISNIYVVRDPSNPDNEGKVFLYKYGKKIFDKLNDAMNPEFEGEVAVNPFDFWEGANFRLKIRKVEGYRNYDKSEFDSPEALLDDDDKLEEIWKQQHSLQEIIDPKNFKPYDELKKKLDMVLGKNTSSSSAATANDEDMGSSSDFDLSKLGSSDPEPEINSSSSEDSGSGEVDDDIAFFQSLANS